MPTKYFNWPPFVAVAIDADTGKPVDPNIGMRVKREFYNVGKDGKGKKVIVAHKTPTGSQVAAAAAEEKGKGGGEKKNGNGKKGGEEKKNDAAGGGDGGDGEKKDAGGDWGADQDKQLLELKAENKTWAQIAEIMGHPPHVLKEKWKPINPHNPANKANANEKKDGNGNGGDGGKKDNNNEPKTEKQAKTQAKQAAKAEAAAAAAAAPAAPAKAPSKPPSAAKAPSAARSDGQARFTMQEWMTLQEDDVFSFGELQCLSELMLRDERQRWQRIASAFYDKTGRRVHPEDVREKFGEMGGMGGSVK